MVKTQMEIVEGLDDLNNDLVDLGLLMKERINKLSRRLDDLSRAALYLDDSEEE